MPSNRKFLLIAIPLAVVLLGLTVYDYGYLRVRAEVAALEDRTFAKKKILKTYLNLIAEKPLVESRLSALKEARKAADSAETIEGQTPSIAAASLETTVKGLILMRGGTTSSERIDKPEDLGKYKIITIAVDGVLPDIRALNDTLYAIETQSPYLVVRELDATIRNFQAPKELTIRLKLSGLTGGK